MEARIGDNLSGEQKAFLFRYIADLIINKAIIDYHLGLVGNYKFRIDDCEGFFTSQWFEYLAPHLDGKKLMNYIKGRMKEIEKQKLKDKDFEKVS